MRIALIASGSRGDVEPVPRKKLTVERLAQAIPIAVSDQALRERAADLGAKIRAEDGIACAVEVVHQLV